MVVISKQLFYEKISDEIQCGHVHYWAKGCVRGNAILAGNVFIGSLKFFLPIYIIKAIINHQKLKDKEFLIDLILGELRSGVYGVLMANFLLMTVCTLCKLTGRLHYYKLGLVSGVVSSLAVLVETKENRTLDTLIFFNLLMDAAFRNMNYFNIVKLTSTRETAMFMVVSSLLMYFLQNRKKNFTNFWFYTPHKFKEEDCENKLEQKCDHKQSCENFTLSGVKKYFLLGYAFSIVRKLIPEMLVVYRKPQEILKILFNIDNIKFGMFIGTYVGLYRYIMCFLLKTSTLNKKYYGAIAGLISGATYAISPNPQVITVGITTISQIFYHNFLKSLEIKNQYVPELVVYMLSHGLLFHNAIMCKRTCPGYYINMLDTCTNNMFRDIYKAIVLKYF